MRKNKNTSKIILATIVAILATMISYSGFSNMRSQLGEQQKLIELMQKTKTSEYKNNFAYAVATKNLKAGEIVADDEVDFQQFQIVNKNAFENRSDIVNKVLLQDITSGDVFTSSHIAKISNDDVTLKEGYRALTLPADSFQGKSEKMKVGTFVDIYSASSDDGWILENIRIVAFEGGKGASSPASTDSSVMDASSITFEVSANSISEFISNISKSKLVLVARGANDKKTHKKKSQPSPSNFSAGAVPFLPNLPASVPITNMSGLPQPIKPEMQASSVEVIEANVKSKVTFD